MQISPYLIFGGQCKPAMEFYKSIFGGELTMSTYREARASKDTVDENKIIHATLKSGPLTIMASDDNSHSKVVMGNNVHISIADTDETQLTEYFNKLSSDGHIDTPLAKQFWGDTFGMVTDQFGVHWMINITLAES